MENGRVKKANKIDYDKAFEERQAKLAGIKKTSSETITDTKGMSAAAKGIILEQEAEKGLADQLFGDAEEDTGKAQKVTLANEKDYKNYGKNVAATLYSG
jgi:hypothetical protein